MQTARKQHLRRLISTDPHGTAPEHVRPGTPAAAELERLLDPQTETFRFLAAGGYTYDYDAVYASDQTPGEVVAFAAGDTAQEALNGLHPQPYDVAYTHDWATVLDLDTGERAEAQRALVLAPDVLPN